MVFTVQQPYETQEEIGRPVDESSVGADIDRAGGRRDSIRDGMG